MPNDRQRRYSEDEVSTILRLAMAPGTQEDERRDGTSLDELLDVAAEAGIDPDLIRAAAERLDTFEVRPKKFDVIGARPYTEIVRVVDGELSDDEWDEVVAEFRSAFEGPTGTASELGKTKEWYVGSEFTGLHVSLTPEGGRTKMKARLTAGGASILGYGATTFFFGIVLLVVAKKSGIVPTFGVPLSLAFGFAAWLGALGLMRWAVGSWYRKMTRQMKDALDRAEAIVSRRPTPMAQTNAVQGDEELRTQLGASD